MAAIMVKLECITNMHVGNGDVNYNIIDNEVEKDPVTGYPTINSSGVKGALREYLKNNAEINKWFGSDDKGSNTKSILKVLSADMLAMPARATRGSAAYYYVTTEEALRKYDDKQAVFVGKVQKRDAVSIQNREAEGIKLTQAQKLFGKEIHIVSEEEFRKLPLPVMARNSLENGKSTNLWYEEVVPHESIFTFVVAADDSDKAALDNFKQAINGKVIQFGGEASIGYGLCKVEVV